MGEIEFYDNTFEAQQRPQREAAPKKPRRTLYLAIAIIILLLSAATTLAFIYIAKQPENPQRTPLVELSGQVGMNESVNVSIKVYNDNGKIDAEVIIDDLSFSQARDYLKMMEDWEGG